MLFNRKDISKELTSFVRSSQFKNFQVIMDDLALAKLQEIQKSTDDASHANLIANRKILNFYTQLAEEMKWRLAQVNRERELAAERNPDLENK